MPGLSPRALRRIKIAVSALLVAVLLWFLDLEAILAALAGTDPALLVLALAMVLANRVLMPVKWNMLLRARAIRLSHIDAVRIYTISSFLGLVLPPTVGADSVRSYYLNRRGLALSDTVASIAVERVFGLVVLLAFTVTGFVLLVDLLRTGSIPWQAFSLALTAITAAALVAVLVSFSDRFRRLAGTLAGRADSSRLGRLARGVDRLVGAYQDYRLHKGILAAFCALTAVELCLVIVRSYVVALALGVELPLVVYFAFLPFVTLMNRMPISFDGFGINEALFIYFLALFGVPGEQGFVIGLVNHMLFLVGVMPGAVFYVLAKPPAKGIDGSAHARD